MISLALAGFPPAAKSDTYQERKQKALDKYNGEKREHAEFREDVHRDYEETQGLHSEYAFAKNTAAPARKTVAHDGDRLRLQKGLYDNKMIQDYVNRVGSSVVSKETKRLFAFRLLSDPVPTAETLSTGTVYISTGLLSLLDNEAQLAYVLAHEMAHVDLDHWLLKSKLAVYQQDLEEGKNKKRGIVGHLSTIGGAAIGAVAGGGVGVLAGDLVGRHAGDLAGLLFRPGAPLDWDEEEEAAADKAALEALLDADYDVREIPNLYVALTAAVKSDARVGLGFLGASNRVEERSKYVKESINNDEQAKTIAEKVAAGGLKGTSPDFSMVLSELKRDNGILALYYDMFALAKSNLEHAIALRPDDPAAHYYYGKVLKLVGRTPEDMERADQEFQLAEKYDLRGSYYGAYLYRALHLMNLKAQSRLQGAGADDSRDEEIVNALQNYITAHARSVAEERFWNTFLPANLDSMYDYLKQSGEIKWKLDPSDISDIGTSALLTRPGRQSN